ncbi:AAA domain-containing protein [Paenimyroides aestuarii]|uniref:AAA domain-containing protein n=1 Tax=Paenimyroides aestuarii TaxID=2968490 RepID=A0ABY5NRD9_9FLAO|nr:AAA domain-containing protein [Paenimyroides aestuarii]UUV21127.1 AAA domain-containing protein [Paenimyroides aestuarii]
MNSFTADVFQAFQNKLKVGNRRGVHLNAIPGNSRYKFDLARLAEIYPSLPERFILDLLTLKNMNFSFSIHDKATSDQNVELVELEEEVIAQEEDPTDAAAEREKNLLKIANSFENLIFQSEAIESEKGINTFGFGFPILIRKDQNDGQITAAPLFIWSVRAKQSSEMNTWKISRTEEDPIYLNEVLINHLQNDSGISLNPIPPEMLEDGKLDKPEIFAICTEILQKLKMDQNIDFLLNNYERIPLLKTKAAYDKKLEKRGDAVIEKCGIFSLFEVQKQNIINDYESLITDFKPQEGTNENKTFQSITSIETDPSQQQILESLKKQSKIVIQGPPGTGKSQTLTAVLINALENKHRTMVVCEKQTALEVLYNALQEKGLGKYCIMIKDSLSDRRLVVDAVRNTIDQPDFKKASELHWQEFLNREVEAIDKLKEKLNTIHHTLNVQLIDNRNWTEIIGTILSLKSIQEPVDLNLISCNFTTDEFQQLLYLFSNGQPLYEKFKPFSASFFYNDQMLLTDHFFAIQNKINEAFAHYKKQFAAIEQQATAFEHFYYGKRKTDFTKNSEQLTNYINETELLTSTFADTADIYDPEKTNGFFYKLLAIVSSKKKKAIKAQKRLIELGHLIKTITQHDDFDAIEISADLLKNKQEILAYKDKLATLKTHFSEKITTDFAAIDVLNYYDSNFTTDVFNELVNNILQLKKQIINDTWLANTDFGTTYFSFKEKITASFETFDNYSSNIENPLLAGHEWFHFYSTLSPFQQQCVAVLYEISNWEQSFLYAYFDKLLKEKSKSILQVSEKNYQDLSKKIENFSSIQKNFIHNFWSDAQKNAVKEFELKNKDLTVANLYNKRKSTNHNRLSLRQITFKDTDLFTAFFPIILTTPDVCCNLFQGKNFYFDNVVFDEASQLKLEDNLPALLKGKNIIVAGDEHQMPPSNYFSKVFDGSVEDEDDVEDEEVLTFKNALLNIESLLDFALENNFQKNHLDFHYRSKHPHLIDFSNHAFYNSRLRPLPASKNEKPIEFYEVGGTFHEHINEEEAEKVLEILEEIQPKANGLYPSVGIATFNITQRNFIRRKILQKMNAPENSAFADKINALEKAGFFIKNLENIQGDERDVIIISTTYGKKKDGRFVQSFGPVNHTKGYKLLNVIVTRAKEKIYICNSIPSEFYSNYKDFLAQEGANNRRAVFYTYLAYCKAVSEENETARKDILAELEKYGNKHSEIHQKPENEFKKQIFQLITENYPTVKATLNYDFGGYAIDILLQPENKPAVAIECMSKEIYMENLAYLEDIHKEKILKKSGYEYIRIWSHNCWQNLDAEFKKIARFL